MALAWRCCERCWWRSRGQGGGRRESCVEEVVQRRFHPGLTSELSLGAGLGVHPSGHWSGLQTSVGHVGGNRWAWTGTWGEDVQGLKSSFGREFCRGSLGLELTSDVCFSSVTLAGSR